MVCVGGRVLFLGETVSKVVEEFGGASVVGEMGKGKKRREEKRRGRGRGSSERERGDGWVT